MNVIVRDGNPLKRYDTLLQYQLEPGHRLKLGPMGFQLTYKKNKAGPILDYWHVLDITVAQRICGMILKNSPKAAKQDFNSAAKKPAYINWEDKQDKILLISIGVLQHSHHRILLEAFRKRF